MTLTLEQVRQTRFHLARRNGYEPVDVDNFVDKVEVTLAQLGEENETLKQQLDAVTAGGETGDGGATAVAHDSAELDTVRRQLNESHTEVLRLRDELEGRNQELKGVRAELDAARAALAEGDQTGAVEKLQGELEQAKGELAQVRDELSGRDARINGLQGELSGVRGELNSATTAAGERTSKIENIVVSSASNAAPAVTKLLQMATEQAERLVGEAEEEAAQLVGTAKAEAERLTSEAAGSAGSAVEEASRKAHETLSGARTRAEEIETTARSAADALAGETQAKAEALKVEIDSRRVDLFSSLETERDDLRGKVDHLRSFEDRYRQSLTTQLRAHLDALSGHAQPDDVPDVLNEPATPSATPRLDALLNDQN